MNDQFQYESRTPLPPVSWRSIDPSAVQSQPRSSYDYEVKSWPQFFGKMVTREKKHDMRDKRDRDYSVGDVVLFREYDPFGGGYSGRWAVFKITYITSNDTPCAMSSVGLGRDMAILSVSLLEVCK